MVSDGTLKMDYKKVREFLALFYFWLLCWYSYTENRVAYVYAIGNNGTLLSKQ
jgi:hypothetical protein